MGFDHAGSKAVDVVELITNLGATWVVFSVLVIVAVGGLRPAPQP